MHNNEALKTGKAWSNVQRAEELAKLLRDKLPDNIEIHVRDDNATWVELPHAGFVRVLDRGANVYDTYVFVGTHELELAGRKIALGLGETIKFVFDLVSSYNDVGKLNSVVNSKEGRSSEKDAQDADWETTEDAEGEENVYDFLKAHAAEMGMPIDPVRNKSLFDLSPIVTAKPGPVMPSAGLSQMDLRVKGKNMKPTEKVGNMVKLHEGTYIKLAGGKVLTYTAEGKVQVLNEGEYVFGDRITWCHTDKGALPIKHNINEEVETGKRVVYSNPNR